MADHSVHYSSERGDWETPPETVDWLRAIFPFDLDACASRPNVAARFISPAADAFATDWRGRYVYCNPPYGRQIGRWTRRAVDMTRRGIATTTVLLIPSRTDTVWFHELVSAICCSAVVFRKGRIKFVGGDSGAPFPSAFVVLGEMRPEQFRALAECGFGFMPTAATKQ